MNVFSRTGRVAFYNCVVVAQARELVLAQLQLIKLLASIRGALGEVIIVFCVRCLSRVFSRALTFLCSVVGVALAVLLAIGRSCG